MVRKASLLIGVCLAITWWVGLSQDRHATILWFDAVAAILSFGLAAMVDEMEGMHAFGPALLGLGLGALFIAGKATHQPAWANWLNFLFAVAYLGVAITAAGVLWRRLPFAARHRTRITGSGS
jgi:hypothetical protein